MSGVSSVVIKIGAETASAVASIRNVDKALGETQTAGQKLQGGIERAAIPAAAALTVLTAAGVASAKAAADDAKNRQLLDSQLQRSLGSTKEAIAANEEWVAGMSDATAVAREELRPALAGAVRATGDLTQAHKLLSTALDISAATGKPLGSITAALGKAYNGSTGALKKLVPSISAGALESGKWAPLQKELNKQFSGAAAGQAATAAGQYAKLQNSMHELQVEIGTALLPVMEAFVPVLTSMFSVAAGHTGIFVAVAGAVAAFAAAILVANFAIGAYGTITTIAGVAQTVWNSAMLRSGLILTINTARTVAYGVKELVVAAATKAWAVAQWLLNVAMNANPIGLAIIAVAALTAGIVLAYRHSSTFRSIVQSAFSGAKSAAQALVPILRAIVDALRSLWQATAPVRSALVSAFDAIWRAIQQVISAIESVISAIGRIHFPSKPSWVPFSAPMAPAGAAAYSVTGGPVINVTVQGAIDPESTAIAIRRTLARYDQRRGRRPLGGAGIRD